MQVEKRISPKEFQELFGLSYYTTYNLMRIRDFPSVRLGSRYYVDVERAIEWFEKKENTERKGVKFK